MNEEEEKKEEKDEEKDEKEEKKGERFNPYNVFVGMSSPLPAPILRNPDLHSNAKGVWSSLAWFAANRGECSPGEEQIRKHAGLKSVKTVRKYLHELERQGFIQSVPPINRKSKHQKEKNTHYFFLKHKSLFENPKDLREYYEDQDK